VGHLVVLEVMVVVALAEVVLVIRVVMVFLEPMD